MYELADILEMLSSRRVTERKKAIKLLKGNLGHNGDNMARLCLHYISEHDPSYTVRNIARQAFYCVSAPPGDGAWERAYLFQKE